MVGGVTGEERGQGIKNLFEKIMIESFPILGKEIDIQVLEVQRVPNKVNPKRPTPRHIIIKMPKVKNRDSYKQQEKSNWLLTRGLP